MDYLRKFRGLSLQKPPVPPISQLAFVWIGGLVAAGMIGYLAQWSGEPLVLGSFGASIFVIFILPDTLFAQPRNVIGGHVVSSLVGLMFFHGVGPEWWSMALALATSLLAMQVLKVPHPPAGSNPFIVFLSGAGWDFLWVPTLVGAVALVLIALFTNNAVRSRTYPRYWL